MPVVAGKANVAAKWVSDTACPGVTEDGSESKLVLTVTVAATLSDARSDHAGQVVGRFAAAALLAAAATNAAIAAAASTNWPMPLPSGCAHRRPLRSIVSCGRLPRGT